MNAAAPLQRSIVVPFQAAPNTGAVVGNAVRELADPIGQFGEALGKAEVQASLVKARLDVAKPLDDLQFKYLTDPDPATAADRFAQDAQKIGDQAGTALKAPAAQQQFTEDFGQMLEARRVSVRHASFERQVSQSNADLDNSIEQFTRQAAFGNPGERLTALASIKSGVDGLVSTGMLDATAGQKKMQTALERLALFDGQRAVEKDPGGAVKALENPAYLPDLDPLARVELQDKAHAEVKAREREARAALSEARLSAAQALSDMHDVVASGLLVSQSVVDQTSQAVMRARDPRLANKFVGLIKAANVAIELRGASPRDVDKRLMELEAQANTSGADAGLAETVTALRKFKTNMNEALPHDALMWAAQQGVVRVNPLRLDGNDSPQDWAARKLAAKTVAGRYGVAPPFLTDAEIETELKPRLAADQNPASRLATVRALVSGLGADAPSVLAKLGVTEPGMATAGGLLLSGKGHETAARDIAAGEQAIVSRPELKPTRSTRTFFGLTKATLLTQALAAVPGEGGRILSAADGIYAARAQRQGLTGTDANLSGSSIYNQAVQEAAGARFDGDTQWGGIVKYRSFPVVVPSTIQADGFSAVMHKVTAADLKAASASGAPPQQFVDGKPLADDTARRLYAVTAGDGLYFLSTTDPSGGQVTAIRDAHGAPYRLDINRALILQQARARKAGGK